MSVRPPDWIDTTPYDWEEEPACGFVWGDYLGDHACGEPVGHDGDHECTCGRIPEVGHE